MTEFEITVNGETEKIHAKHLGNGKYTVRHLKTCNFAEVKSIETLFGNEETTSTASTASIPPASSLASPKSNRR